jgi:deoxyhypusine monooxygenase
MSVDPAPPFPAAPVNEQKDKLLSQNLSIFNRYRALFALRDDGSEESVLALCEAFGDSSALLKHEIAFVLGQLQHSAAVPYLLSVIEKTSESAMVRHEAAEALGAIAADTALPVLRAYAQDPEPIVRESCIVALDVHDYFNSDQFQYADGIKLQLEKKQDQIKTSLSS